MDGFYLKETMDLLGFDQNKIAEEFACEKDTIVNYCSFPEKPLQVEHAKKLELLRENFINKKNLHSILLDLKQQIKESPNSFSPNKIFAHPDKLVDIIKSYQNNDNGFSIFPFLVEIHLTNNCSHKCPNCTFSSLHKRSDAKNAEFDKEHIKSILDELEELGIKAIFWSGGGDPLCYPFAEEIFEYAAKKNFKQLLITNGAHLDKIDNNILIKYFSTVRISLDSHISKTFSKIHGFTEDEGAMEFSNITNNIKKLVKTFTNTSETERNPDINKIGIGVSFLLTLDNVNEIIGFYNLAKNELGVQYAEMKPLVYDKNNKNNEIIKKLLVDSQLVEMLRLLKQEKEKDKKFRFFTLEHKFIDMLSDDYGRTFKKCWGHSLYPTIAADGGVYPCCLMVERNMYLYGNLKNNSFKNIWKSNERKSTDILVTNCPINCKLSETNKVLQTILDTQKLELREYIN